MNAPVARPPRRTEAVVVREIELALGAPEYRDVTLEKTPVIRAKEHDMRGGVFTTRRIQAGIVGQSDLRATLRVTVGGVVLGAAALAFEVKGPETAVEDHQWRWLAGREALGWFVAVVRSGDDACALVRAARRALKAGLRGDLATVTAERAALRAPLDVELARIAAKDVKDGAR